MPDAVPAALPDAVHANALAHVQRRLARLAQPPWLHAEVARRMAERLPIVKLQPQRVLDWGAFLGAGAAPLAAAYPKAQRVPVEADAALLLRSQPPARRWWQRGAPVSAPLAAHGVPSGQAQLVWANMALHGQADRAALFGQWQAALAVGGFLMFSTLGPDTARELVALYLGAGHGPAQAPLPDMHDLGDDLVHAGFADPVMDQEHLRLSWSSPQALLDELRQWGGNAHPQRHAGLRTPRWRARLHEALAARADAAGRIQLTVELVYGHAFKAAPRRTAAGEATVSLEHLRRSSAGQFKA